MRKINEIYKCDICGNIVEFTHGGVGVLVCCAEDMKLQAENTSDGAAEKHVPVVERTEDGLVVTVGEIDHPMEKEHFIEWIEVIFENGNCKKYLIAGDKPVAKFKIKAEKIEVRAYCNLHGLWKL